MLNDFAIPAPPEITTPPVVTVVELSVELNVALPVAAPNEIVVAAPKAFMVVAVVLKTAKVASAATTLVVNVGVVANVSAPEPDLSDIADEIADEVVDAETVPEEIVRTPEELLRF